MEPILAPVAFKVLKRTDVYDNFRWQNTADSGLAVRSKTAKKYFIKGKSSEAKGQQND